VVHVPRTAATFQDYVASLEDLASRVLRRCDLDPERISMALDGDVADQFRRLVPLDERKAAGAFLTGSMLGERVAEGISRPVGADSVIVDPCCGAGDLLLRFLPRLPVTPDLHSTLTEWGDQVIGVDLNSDLLRAARARFVIAAGARGIPPAQGKPLDLDSLFPHVRVGNGLTETNALGRASHVAVNPPYTVLKAIPECEWGAGSVSTAAVFLEKCVKAAPPGSEVAAILPDVLRAGTRYKKWRAAIASRADLRQLDIYGSFDPQVDVDVFVLHLLVRGDPAADNSESWWHDSSLETSRFSDYFRISVGPVVPHRHAEEGEEVAYLCAHRTIPWRTIRAGELLRRFSGRTVRPPFLVVRRTSSPSDAIRAVGTIITGDLRVAVENHLLILEPADGSLERCERALEILHDTRTTDWLNERIRCRHLTVGAVASIPWLAYD